MENFKLGDEVTWSSQSGGYRKDKTGIIAVVIPPGRYVPDVYPEIRGPGSTWGGGMERDHESYIVKVGKKLYWPRVKDLHKTYSVNKQEDPKWPDWMKK